MAEMCAQNQPQAAHAVRGSHELPCAPGARLGRVAGAPSSRAASLIELRPAGATRRAASFGR